MVFLMSRNNRQELLVLYMCENMHNSVDFLDGYRTIVEPITDKNVTETERTKI